MFLQKLKTIVKSEKKVKEIVAALLEEYGTLNDGCGCCSDQSLRQYIENEENKV